MPEESLQAVKPLEAQSTAPVVQRSLLVDVVRGFAIALVAIGHTDQGTARRGWWGPSHFGDQLWIYIYEFHMPAFFFVSGIFLRSSVVKRGPRKFVDSKVAQMLYPYLVWSVLEYLSQYPLRPFMQMNLETPREFVLELLGGSTLWFLPAIFFCVVLGMLFRNVNKPLLLALAVAVALLPVQWPIHFVTETVAHFPYLVAGMWLARGYERVERISLPVAGVGALLLGLLVSLVSRQPPPHHKVPDMLAGFVGIGMLFLLARCCRKGSFARTMAWVGEASFGVYLLSAYFQGAGRELLLRGLHSTNPWLQLAFPSLLAIFVPAWIYQHRARLRVDWLFVWPF